MEKIKVVFCDDHRIVREGLTRIVQNASGFGNCSDVGSVDELMKVLKTQQHDILVLDISMPGTTGINALPKIRELNPTLPILMMSMFPEENYGIRCAKLGANGYVTKDSPPEVLINAIRTVAGGKTFFSSEVIAGLFQGNKEGELPHKELSEREYEVFMSIAQGKTQGDIAKELFLSPKTISTYKTRILEKLKISSVAELTRYAIENGLL